MLTWSDIITYLRLFLRWWFVLVLAVVLSVGTAWTITRQQPSIYAAQATLRVGNNFEVAAPNQAQVALSNVLADYYAALVKREVILAPVVDQLQLGFEWWVIRDRMLVPRVDRGANLLELTVSDTNPERAAAIANAVANQLIAYTPNAPEKVEAQQAELSRQLEETQVNIEAVEVKIAELEDNLANLSSAIDIADIQSQLDALQVTRQRYLDEYANLLNLTNQTSANSLSFFEQARPAVAPLPKKLGLTLAMAGAGGLLMAIVAVLILDRLDERWRTGSELQSRTGIRSLGDVPEGLPSPSGARPNGLARHQALNTVYSNMVHAAKSKLPRTLLISSPRPSEARSALAIDIAEQYTRTGHRVLLIATEAEQAASLAGLVDHEHYVPSIGRRDGGDFGDSGNLWSYVRPTRIHNLLLLSGREAGYDRFSSMVPLVFWPEMLTHLRKSADVVIFDGPGTLAGPDAGLLAPLVDGVMLVLNGKQDSRSTALKARKQLTSEPNTKFLGAVVTARNGRQKQEPEAEKGKGSGFQIAVGRQGITITMGPPAPVPSLNAGSHVPPQRLLHSPAIEVEAVPVDVNPVTAASPVSASPQPGPDPVSWDDLLELERGASGARGNGHGAEEQSREVGGGAPWVAAEVVQPASASAAPKTIITPPPSELRVTPLEQAATDPAAASLRPGRQRRARIANSRRAGRQVGSQPLEDGRQGD